jgi:fluoroquinolone resistance protein
MERNYIEDKIFDKADFNESPMPKGDYENCTFLGCNFSGTNLSGINFAECEFKACNISLARLDMTSFKDVKFIDCKLLGLHFEGCNDFLFTVYFENCILNLSSFYKRNLRKTKFINTTLKEVDFTEADISAALFDDCDFSGATFERTVLEKADFRSSFNFSIDPETNKIKKAKFSAQGAIGLLDKYDIDIS